MTARARNARHRARSASPVTIVAKSMSMNAKGVGRQAAIVVAASGLVLAGTGGANASSVATPTREASTPTFLEAVGAAAPVITADPAAHVTFERPKVESKPAPPKPAPAKPATAVLPAAASTPQPRVAVQAAPVLGAGKSGGQRAQTGAGVTVAEEAQASAGAAIKPAPSAVPASKLGAAIAAAAYAQLGVHQDCTMLVTNSLATVGIHFHDWPAGYLSLGPTVSAGEAQPGDLVYYPDGGMGEAHIAVYVGNGMAVHGGWNGSTTVLFSVNVGHGHTFIRVNG